MNDLEILKEDYITYEQAMELKRLGFSVRCNSYYSKDHKGEYDLMLSALPTGPCALTEDLPAPSIYTVLKWLRNTRGIFIWAQPHCVAHLNEDNRPSSLSFDCFVKRTDSHGNLSDHNNYILDGFKTMEDALSAGLTDILPLLKRHE